MLKRILILVFIIIVIIACKSNNPVDNDFELNPLLTEDMVKKITLQEGAWNDSLILIGNIVWKYAISVPDINEGEKVPFVLALHWAGQDDEHIPYFNCLAEPAFRKLKGIIFAPSAGEWYFWDENNYPLILTFIEYAKKYWPIDEDKIVVTGYSNGGIATWFFGTDFHQYFSAAIPISSRATEFEGKLRIPFYAIHGSNDDVFLLSDLEERVQELQNLGSDIQLHVIEGYGHYDACSYGYYAKDAADWLLNDVWK